MCRIRDVKKLAAHDIVVTTYETLSSDMQGRSKKVKGDSNPVASIQWHRLVLDESHAVKDQSSRAFKAIDAIQSACRWACTGTPINTVCSPRPCHVSVMLCVICPCLLWGVVFVQFRSQYKPGELSRCAECQGSQRSVCSTSHGPSWQQRLPRGAPHKQLVCSMAHTCHQQLSELAPVQQALWRTNAHAH